MTRHNCRYCKRKRNEDKMSYVYYKTIRKNAWLCNEHLSSLADISIIETDNTKPYFVELFAGSGHVSELARQRGFQTVTIDNNPKLNPDITIDVLNLRRSQLPKNVVIVWASVPCTVYSILNIKNHWKKIELRYRDYLYIPDTYRAVEALNILNATLKLILEMNPTYFFIENPRGALRHMQQMKIIPYRNTVSYADYGFDYYKPTDIFHNCKYFKPKKIKTCVGRKFESSVENLSGNYERSLIPRQLINEMLDSIQFLIPQSQVV